MTLPGFNLEKHLGLTEHPVGVRPGTLIKAGWPDLMQVFRPYRSPPSPPLPWNVVGHRDVRRQAREARRRQNVIKFIAVASVARLARDRRTQVAVIAAVARLAAAASLAAEGGNPLEWYLARGRGDRPGSKGHG